jgi:hypothetical protein
MKFIGTAYGNIGGHYPILVYLNPGKHQRIKIRELPDMREEDMVLSTIARLGTEGWELVSSGNATLTSDNSQGHFLYFKRPI